MKSTTSRKPADRPLPPGSPRFLHCFLEWFKKNQGRFAIPVSVKKIRASNIVLAFPSTTGCIYAHVHSRGGWDEIVVCARWKGERDIIHESESEALATDNAYVCALCEGPHELFPSLDAMWVSHVFDHQFLAWVNEKLAKSHSITFIGDDGWFSAELSLRVRKQRSRRFVLAHVPFVRQPNGAWYMERASGEIKSVTDGSGDKLGVS